MLDVRKWTLLFATTLALLAGFAQAEDRPPVADKVMAYSGQQGVKVWTLRIGERSDNQAWCRWRTWTTTGTCVSRK